MTAFNKKNLITNLHDRTVIVRNNINNFLQLSNEQLLSAPEAGKWSIAEVFEHLNITHRIFLKFANRALENAPINSKDDFNSGWVGNFIYKRILPRTDGTVYKMKAPGFLQVKTAVPNGNTTIERLLRYIDDFDHILEQGSYVDIQQLRVPVPGVPLVSFRLGDCLRFMVAHNERHLLQAQKIFATFVPQPAVQPYKSPGSTGSDLVNVFGN